MAVDEQHVHAALVENLPLVIRAFEADRGTSLMLSEAQSADVEKRVVHSSASQPIGMHRRLPHVGL
jgi:hypothetical protein